LSTIIKDAVEKAVENAVEKAVENSVENAVEKAFSRLKPDVIPLSNLSQTRFNEILHDIRINIISVSTLCII